LRADRLVAILMLLQRNGRMSASRLARELEVSTRTIYRDMNALSIAGVPVYCERGAEGGCCLVEDYRTELTGLTPDESQALLLLTVPSPLDALEVGANLKAALRKLYATLPQQEQGILLDWGGGKPSSTPLDNLNLFYRALKQRRMVRFEYSLMGIINIEVTSGVLGLVAHEGAWNLVYLANEKISTHPVTSLSHLEILEESFSYPEDFNLQICWEELRARGSSEEAHLLVKAWVKDNVVRFLQMRMEPDVENTPTPSRPGWKYCSLTFPGMERARRELLPLGSAVEVLEPQELRFSLLDYARQIAAIYDRG